MKYIDEERVKRLSINDNSTLYQRIIKVSEESGELSQAFLKYDKSEGASASATGSVEAIIEEACDVINCAMDVINFILKDIDGIEDKDNLVLNIFNTKLDKWEAKQAIVRIKKELLEL